MTVLWILVNEAAAFIVLTLAFPGFLPPRNGIEVFQTILMFFAFSLVWPVYLIMLPFLWAILWCTGLWHPCEIGRYWPWGDGKP